MFSDSSQSVRQKRRIQKIVLHSQHVGRRHTVAEKGKTRKYFVWRVMPNSIDAMPGDHGGPRHRGFSLHQPGAHHVVRPTSTHNRRNATGRIAAHRIGFHADIAEFWLSFFKLLHGLWLKKEGGCGDTSSFANRCHRLLQDQRKVSLASALESPYFL
jgi:hypothetical protein